MEIYAQGSADQVDGFLKDLEERPPKRAAILKINTEDISAEDAPQFDAFDIIESEKTKGEIFVSPDIAICDECKEECTIRRSAVFASVYQLYLLRTAVDNSGFAAVRFGNVPV